MTHMREGGGGEESQTKCPRENFHVALKDDVFSVVSVQTVSSRSLNAEKAGDVQAGMSQPFCLCVRVSKHLSVHVELGPLCLFACLFNLWILRLQKSLLRGRPVIKKTLQIPLAQTHSYKKSIHQTFQHSSIL